MTRTALLIPVAALIAFTGCAAKSTPVPTKATETKPVELAKAKIADLPIGIAVNATAAGAKAGPKDETPAAPTRTVTTVIGNGVVVTNIAPAPPVPPTPPTAPAPPAPPTQPIKLVKVGSTTGPAVKAPQLKLVKIRSDKPHATEDRAVEDALEVAQIELMKRFAQLDPPVTAKPSVVRIRRDFLRKDSVATVKPTAEEAEAWAKSGIEANRVWAEIDVEVSESQIQDLRSTERVGTGVRIAGAIFAVLLAVYGFLRLEAYTRGYLTFWLALGGAVVVGLGILLAVLGNP